LSRQSEHSLYRTDLSSFTMGESYDQKDAAGFIRILGLPSRSRALLERQKHSAEGGADHARCGSKKSKKAKAEEVAQ
jgi:hypothetical protein